MNIHEKISYVEFATKNIEKTKAFFSDVFGWTFVDYGEEYASFARAGLNGGFYKSDSVATSEGGAPLIVFYSESLESTMIKVEKFGATISKPIFDFPGGRRFQFIEPGGNEIGVWSDR